MAAPFTTAMLALNPDSFWLCSESGATLADSVGGKDLTVRGTPSARGVAVSGFPGVDPGINFGNTEGLGWATIATPLTQIATNKFSVVGMFYLNVNPSGSSEPFFCASYSGGHVNPFYIFSAFSTAGSSVEQMVIDTTGTLAFFTNGVMPPTGGWHLLGMTYDGANAVRWLDTVSATASITGNLHDTMGSFSLNNIPALDSSTFAGAIRAGSVGYWHDYTVTSSDVTTLFAAAQSAPPLPAGQFLNPGSVSAPLRV